MSVTIHPTAIVAEGAILEDGVEIGPYCVVGPHVRLGAATRLMSHVVVDGHTTLGAGCRVFPFASLGTETQDLKYKGGAPRVEIGAQTTLREYVTVNAATADGDVTRVGSRCLMMAYVHVAHDCVVGDEVIIANCGTLAGHVVLEDQCILGGLSAVHQFCRVGRLAIIGGCSRVTQDVPPFMMAAETPLRVPTINSVGLKRHGVSDDVQRRLKMAHRLLYREKGVLGEVLDRIAAELGGVPEVDHLVQFIRSSERGVVR